MICPHCSAPNLICTDSRPSDDSAAIRRRRRCTACGYRFTTMERMVTDASSAAAASDIRLLRAIGELTRPDRQLVFQLVERLGAPLSDADLASWNTLGRRAQA